MSIIIFAPDIQIYRGSRQITKAMFPEELRKELPPESIASLGKLLTLEPEAVNPLVAIRQRVYRTLAAAGTPYFGGFGVGPKLAPRIAEKLAELKKEFLDEKTKLLSSYNAKLQGMVLANPKWGQYISDLAGTSTDVESATSFRVLKYKAEIVELPGDNDAEIEARGLPAKIAGEADSVLRDFLTECLGKEKVTQRGLKVLRQVSEKLADLCFLDGSLVPRATMFANMVEAMPLSGPLSGGELEHLKRNVRAMLGEQVEEGQASLFEEELVI